MKRTLVLAAAIIVTASVAGCGTSAGGGTPVDQTAAGGGRVYGAATLETLLKETEKTLGAGTIENDATVRKTTANAATSSPLDTLTAVGAVISPATCASALTKAVTLNSNLFAENPGAVGAALKYKRGAVVLLTVKDKPLPGSIYDLAKVRAEASVTACSPMSITVGAQTVPIKITKLTAPTRPPDTWRSSPQPAPR